MKKPPIGLPARLHSSGGTQCIALILAGFLFASCQRGSGKEGGGPGQSGPAPVLTALAAAKTVPVRLRAIGTVEAMATVAVRSQVGGVLAQAHFQEGGKVNQGDPLFTVDSRPYESVVKQVEALLEQDRVQAELARKEAERVELLYQDGLVSEDTLDRTRTAAQSKAAAVRADRASLDNARLQLAYCRIQAPITGQAGQRLVDEGNLVRINDPVLVVLNQLAPIQVTFSVPETQLASIRKYMAQGPLRVEAYLSGEPDPAAGELTFVDNAVDPGTGTILLQAVFPNQDERLWPGQYVDVALTLTRLTDAVVVPSRAIQTGQQGPFVFAVKSDRTVEVVPVTPGLSLNEETVIEQGLAAGAEVVTDGQLRLTPGAKVEIKSGLVNGDQP